MGVADSGCLTCDEERFNEGGVCQDCGKTVCKYCAEVVVLNKDGSCPLCGESPCPNCNEKVEEYRDGRCPYCNTLVDTYDGPLELDGPES